MKAMWEGRYNTSSLDISNCAIIRLINSVKANLLIITGLGTPVVPDEKNTKGVSEISLS